MGKRDECCEREDSCCGPTVAYCKDRLAELEKSITNLCYEFVMETGLVITELEIENGGCEVAGLPAFSMHPTIRVFVAL